MFPIAAIAAATGARRGEILALRWADVDLDAGAIRIERSVEETQSKDVRIKGTKNKSSKRTIGVDPGLVGLLRGHKARQAEAALARGRRPIGCCSQSPRPCRLIRSGPGTCQSGSANWQRGSAFPVSAFMGCGTRTPRCYFTVEYLCTLSRSGLATARRSLR